MDNITEITALPVRILAEYVLIKQVMLEKKTKIITVAGKEKDRFDYYFEVVDKGPDCKRGISIGETPIFAEHVRFQGVSVQEKTEEGMVTLLIVHEGDIIGVDLVAKKLQLTSKNLTNAN